MMYLIGMFGTLFGSMFSAYSTGWFEVELEVVEFVELPTAEEALSVLPLLVTFGEVVVFWGLVVLGDVSLDGVVVFAPPLLLVVSFETGVELLVTLGVEWFAGGTVVLAEVLEEAVVLSDVEFTGD